MATFDIPILGAFTGPDDSGDIIFEPLEDALTLGTATFGTTYCYTMLAPTGSDIGIYGKFNIPQNYAGTPVIVIRGALGQAGSTLGFGFQQVSRADSESIDVAYEAQDLASNSTWTGYATEDMYEETITLTPSSAYVAGDEVFYFFYRDNSVDTQTGAFHLTGLFFRYSDT